MNQTQQQFNISLTQTYLEMARAALCTRIVVNSPNGLVHNNDATSDPRWPELAAAICSLTMIYGYMAVESFTNYQLYQLWEQSRRHHGQPNFPPVPQTPQPLLNEFFAAFGTEDQFLRLKDRKEIKQLPQRINTVCRHLGIRSVSEVHQHEWADFLKLARNVRHFLIHPFPDEGVAQQAFTSVINANKVAEAMASIVCIITHFYTETRRQPPDWLKDNTLFRIVAVQFPLEKNSEQDETERTSA